MFEDRIVSILDSIVASIPACHAGDRGSIPRLGGSFFKFSFFNNPLDMFTKTLNDLVQDVEQLV